MPTIVQLTDPRWGGIGSSLNHDRTFGVHGFATAYSQNVYAVRQRLNGMQSDCISILAFRAKDAGSPATYRFRDVMEEVEALKNSLDRTIAYMHQLLAVNSHAFYCSTVTGNRKKNYCFISNAHLGYHIARARDAESAYNSCTETASEVISSLRTNYLPQLMDRRDPTNSRDKETIVSTFNQLVRKYNNPQGSIALYVSWLSFDLEKSVLTESDFVNSQPDWPVNPGQSSSGASRATAQQQRYAGQSNSSRPSQDGHASAATGGSGNANRSKSSSKPK